MGAKPCQTMRTIEDSFVFSGSFTRSNYLWYQIGSQALLRVPEGTLYRGSHFHRNIWELKEVHLQNAPPPLLPNRMNLVVLVQSSIYECLRALEMSA